MELRFLFRGLLPCAQDFGALTRKAQLISDVCFRLGQADSTVLENDNILSFLPPERFQQPFHQPRTFPDKVGFMALGGFR